MPLQSPPSGFAARPAIDFNGHPARRCSIDGSPDMTMRHERVATILESVADMADVRPVVFDRRQALDRLGGLEDLLMEVLQVMRAEVPKGRAQLERTLANREAVELKRVAHTLKGSASIVGARDLVARLHLIESLAAASNFDAVLAELPEINRQFDSLQRYLSEETQIEQP